MKFKELNKEIKGVFKPAEMTTYFGKLKHGSPYFYPRNYNPTIISVRKLKLHTDKEVEEKNVKYPYNKNKPGHKFSNYPMVRRKKNWIKKIFGNYYYIALGSPISIKSNTLGWKDKYNSPRFEWMPGFYIYFFGLQYCAWMRAPRIGDEEYVNNDKYYEMVLWYLHYSDKDIKKAEETWGWVDSNTKKSTWEKKNLIGE